MCKRKIVLIIEDILKAFVYERHITKDLWQFLNCQLISRVWKGMVAAQRERMKQDIRLSLTHSAHSNGLQADIFNSTDKIEFANST